MSSTTQIGESRNSLLTAIVLFGLVVAFVIASAYYLDPPSFDPILLGP